MSRLVVEGGIPLSGEVKVSRAKNAVLPVLAATLLTKGECVIKEVPRLRDVEVMKMILRRLGAHVESEEQDPFTDTVRVSCKTIESVELAEDLTRQMRSSIFIMGALLGRAGSIKIAHPGGCTIGHRPFNMHLDGLRVLGASIDEQHGFINATASKLRGAAVYLDYPSVGATENLMMAGVLATGVTTIHNAAKEPEIVDLQRFLRAIGARIGGAGSGVIRVEGRGGLVGCVHRPIPDRIEAGTFAAAAGATGGSITLVGALPHHMEAILAKLRSAGVEILPHRGALDIVGPDRPTPADLKTQPYPGYPTDMQNQFLALLCRADGISIVKETVFENRFKVAEEFRRMGADIRVEDRIAIVRGASRLTGAQVEGEDLRGTAALLVAGLSAEGKTVIESCHHLDRGYAGLVEKMRSLGAKVNREG